MSKILLILRRKIFISIMSFISHINSHFLKNLTFPGHRSLEILHLRDKDEGPIISG